MSSNGVSAIITVRPNMCLCAHSYWQVSVGTLSAFTIVSVCLLVLRYVPPLDRTKPVVQARTPEGLPVVPKPPSRPIFTSQYPIFSPVLTILSEASLHTLPGRSIVGDCASSSSSTGSVLRDETEDFEETMAMAESPPSSAVDLQNPLLLPELQPVLPGIALFFYSQFPFKFIYFN